MSKREAYWVHDDKGGYWQIPVGGEPYNFRTPPGFVMHPAGEAVTDAEILWDMRMLDTHLKDSDSAIPMLVQGVRRVLRRVMRPAEAQPGEWVLVPREPTLAMVIAWRDAPDVWVEAYAAMLHAAPQPPAEAQPVGEAALRCTCPSGDGSLRWPCPAHPPEAQGGGDMTECGHSKYDPCHNCEPLDAPPSTPVGVERILAEMREEGQADIVDGGVVLEWEDDLRNALAQQPSAAPVEVEAPADEFNGDTPRLIRCIESLLRLDAAGALVPHGVGGHARTMLAAAAKRLAQQPTPSAPVGVEDADLVTRLDAIHQRVFGKPYPTEALAQQPAPVEVDELAQVIRELDGKHSLGAGALAEAILEKFPALAQQPAACPKCGGTGEADSGGIMPWGAPAMILCECQQPAADEEAAEQFRKGWQAGFAEGRRDQQPAAAAVRSNALDLAEEDAVLEGYDDAIAQQPAAVALSREELDTCRQWFDSVQDTNGGYLSPPDYVLATKLYRALGMRVPQSISRIAALRDRDQEGGDG